MSHDIWIAIVYTCGMMTEFDEFTSKALVQLSIENSRQEDKIISLTKQNADLVALLEEVKPTFYGMLLIEFGNPDEWPEDRQGIVVFRKLLQALAKEE